MGTGHRQLLLNLMVRRRIVETLRLAQAPCEPPTVAENYWNGQPETIGMADRKPPELPNRSGNGGDGAFGHSECGHSTTN